MRPTLPFNKSEVLEFLQWCTEAYSLDYVHPLSILKKILERFSKAKSIDTELNEAIAKFAAALRASKNKDAMKIATSLDSLYTSAAPQPAKSSKKAPPAVPSEYGSPMVHVELKRMLGIAAPKAIKNSTLLEPDRFPLHSGSPLAKEHQEWSLLLHEVVKAGQKYDKAIEKGWNGWLKFKSPSERGKLILAGSERKVHTMQFDKDDKTIPDLYHLQLATYRATNFMMRSEYQIARQGAVELMAFMASVWSPLSNEERGVLNLIKQMETEAKKSALAEGERFVLSILRDAMIKAPLLGKSDEPVTKLTNLIGDQKRFVLVPGEPWVDALHMDFSATHGSGTGEMERPDPSRVDRDQLPALRQVEQIGDGANRPARSAKSLRGFKCVAATGCESQQPIAIWPRRLRRHARRQRHRAPRPPLVHPPPA